MLTVLYLCYSVKIVIRGERGTGKTSLLHRLQGRPVPAQHEPTAEIQTANINWNFKNTDEVIKVRICSNGGVV